MGEAASRMTGGWSEGRRLELGLEPLEEEVQRVAAQVPDLPEDPEERARRVYLALREEEEP